MDSRLARILSFLLSDEWFVRLQFRRHQGYWPKLNQPVTFNEKINWLKIYNKNPLLTKCADKIEVRSYLEQLGLAAILNDLYGIFDDANEIDFDSLPDRAYIKTNHGSGTNAVWDRSRPFDIDKFRREFNYALRQNFFWRTREWPYRNIEPKILIEPILVQEPHLLDYRFLCFSGEVKLIMVDIETATKDGRHYRDARRNIYDREFNLLDLQIGREPYDAQLSSRPDNLPEMISYAETLSAPFPLCRVDLYNIEGRIVFGELTFYHGGGMQKVEPRRWEEVIGSWIPLDGPGVVLRH